MALICADFIQVKTKSKVRTWGNHKISWVRPRTLREVTKLTTTSASGCALDEVGDGLRRALVHAQRERDNRGDMRLGAVHFDRHAQRLAQ
jgi:hypothetical protein